jgi:hypothetical protein
VAIPLQYDDALPASEGLACVSREGVWGALDLAGRRVIEPRFERLDPFSSGLAVYDHDEFCGFVRRSGEPAVQPAYDDAGPFVAGRAAVWAADWAGYIDSRGNVVVRWDLDDVVWLGDFSEGLAAVTLSDGTARYVDADGRTAFSVPADWAESVSEGLAAVQEAARELADGTTAEGRWGYADRTGALVIPHQFDEAYDFLGGLAEVWLGDKMGYVDRTGRWVWMPAR